MRMLLALAIALWFGNVGEAATNDVLPFRTNFVHGTSLSATELEAVVKLANHCGIQSVAQVSTELHLSGMTIQVAGDEKFEARAVILKTLQIHGKGSRRVRPADAPSVGEFWAEPGKPRQEERTIVRIADRQLRVGLLNGIKPAGADKILDAFANGRVQFRNETLKDALSDVDVMQSEWIGITLGKPYIIFASSPNRLFLLTLDGAIRDAKARWATESGNLTNTIPTEHDLYGVNDTKGFLPHRLTCPRGGFYTFGSVAENPRCSLSENGHRLE